jgi:hypothetical protein
MQRLALVSACALFLELGCIRWAGSHVLYLSYVSNLVLVAAFFGLGLGAVLSASLGPRAIERLLAASPAVLLAFVAVCAFAGFEVQIDGTDVTYFRNARGANPLPPWLVLPAIGVLIMSFFATLGLAVGRELSAAPRLTAYSVDIAGSLTGIVLFSLVSFTGTPAYLWFLVPSLCLLLLLPGRGRILAPAATAVLATALVVAYADEDSTWSPYQRVSVRPLGVMAPRVVGDPSAGSPGYRLRVNNVVHQYISDVRRREPFYEFAYQAAGARLPGGRDGEYLTATPPSADWSVDPWQPRPGWKGRVAIIGAGNGTDTAVALAYGAGHVDAVEIDPLLAEIGRNLQPNRPFSDPRASVHVMDGRTFLERARGPYDLVVFGLPDSLTLASPYAGLRLESFLFTEEAFRSALRVLHPERGLLVAYNYYRTRWLVDRIATTMKRASGQTPRVLVGPDKNLSAVFIAGPGLARVPASLGDAWGFRAVAQPRDVGSATDDWPFLYLRERAVPSHILLGLCVLVAFGGLALAVSLRLTAAPVDPGAARVPLRELVSFFFMGAAFLLLETSGLVRMSLLFGATWFVNALVFAAVLSLVLLANGLAHLFPLRDGRPVLVLLLAALGVAYLLPPDALSSWNPLAKYLTSTLVLFTPILLGNLAFSRAFRDCQAPARAFGANLLGAVIGGALENSALVIGYRALFLVAGVLYVAAFWSAVPLAQRQPGGTRDEARR